MPSLAINPYDALAEAFCYPEPGKLEALEADVSRLPTGPSKKSFAAFLGKIRNLDLGEWEELYTRTLDLNPPAAPYVGFQVWGESYQRGAFLAQMSHILAEASVDTHGELPDHLAPVLRYLGSASEPNQELVGLLEQALQRMLAVLRKAEAENPYIHLLEAARDLCKSLKKEES